MEGPRACLPEELRQTLLFLNSIFRSGSDQKLETDYPLIFNCSKSEYMRIIKEGDRVVAHVPVAPRTVILGNDTFTAGIISPTGTHPDYRHRGYATQCLHDCLSIMLKNDWPVSLLWTREATFPFYQKSGFEPVGPQQRAYPLSLSDREMLRRGDLDVVIYNSRNSEHLDAVIEIHDSERFRIGRSRDDYAKLFCLPKTVTLLAFDCGRAISYLVVSWASNKPGIIEGGGDAKALEALFAQALFLFQTIDNSVYALTPLISNNFGDVLERKKPGSAVTETEAGVGFQMMRVNSLFSLMTKTTSHLRKNACGLSGQVCLFCTDDGEAVTLSFREGEVTVSPQRLPNAVELNRRQLTRLIFGSHPASDPVCVGDKRGEILNRLFPYYLPIWGLDHS